MNLPTLSLLVGSDDLGWADLGASAVIGERTKGMPGGDGSLSFTLPPDVAAKARNQLQHKARVKLTANGAPDFGGRICSDPFGGVLAPVKDAVTVECSGLWAWADRYGAFAWVWNDSDTSQWTTTAQVHDEGSSELIASDAEAAKYTADTEGRLFILADSGAAFAASSTFRLDYWLLSGLETGCEIVGLDVEYKCNLPVLMAGGAWLHDVSFSDNTHGWAVGEGGVILATTDGGQSWTAQDSGSTELLWAVAVHDASTAWAVGNNGTILVTANGGATWSAQTSDTTAQLFAVTFVDASKGWAVGYLGTILVTTNGGATWTAQASGTTVGLLAVTFPDATHGWAVGHSGTILATTNGGTTWTAQTSETTEHLLAVAFNEVFQDAYTGCAVGMNGTVRNTMTGGTTWLEQDSGSSEPLTGVTLGVNVLGWVPGWAVGYSGAIVATTDNGFTWETQDSPRTENIYGVAFSDADHGWAVGYSGAILATTDGGETWVTQNSGTTGPGPWRLWFTSGTNPWHADYVLLNGAVEATTREDWYATSFDLDPAYPNQALSMGLHRSMATPWTRPTPEVISDPWVWVKSVTVRCRMNGAVVDRTVDLSDVLCDMAAQPGLATVTAGEVVSLGEGNNQIAVRSMTSIRSGMADLAGLYSGELEYWFDLDKEGADRFSHYEKPAAADPTRNSCWHYGDAAGESVAGLDHDPEACPDWIRMTYLADGVATIPNGTPRDVWYPATPPTTADASVRVITEFAGQMFTDAHAAAAAQRVHARIAASEWSGSVPVPFTMTDVAGRERGGWQVRQGDRLSVPSLNGADDLYVTEVSWNWTTLTGSATVGYPWEVTGMLGTEAAVPAPFVRPSMIEG